MRPYAIESCHSQALTKGDLNKKNIKKTEIKKPK
jgi:hypothetical protein